MKKMKISFIFVVLASLILTVGIVKASSLTVDSLTVGKQGSGGVTYFNGTIINNTTGSGGADNPVTFGDNVRIDGRVYRGAAAGTGDTMPFIVNDNMEILGNLTVDGNIIYNNSVSGLSATSVQSAIDELGTDLDFSLRGGQSVWTGYAYYVADTGFGTSELVTVIFTPISDTEGTYTSTPFNTFCYRSGINDCENDTEATYKVIGNTLFITDVEGLSSGLTANMDVRGDTINFFNTRTAPGVLTVLTRQ